ncbi:MAG: DNA polymerase III subunit delta' [Acidobacteria bacterium]|nr:DNA polymerase III subunit delta' [Acidobacteriota bacterium]
MPFRDIIGHRKLVGLLARSIARESLPPSLIFSGPAGVGKFLAAISTAQALNCLSPVPFTSAEGHEAVGVDACGRCAACTRIARGMHPDVLILKPNEKGNIKIDPVREAVERAGYRPFEGRRRVTVVDSADGLEIAAQNSLLKVLEEPPASSVFILVTALPDTLLQTVRSRCPQLRFRGLPPQDVVAALGKLGHDERQARRAALMADGSIGAAVALRDAEDDDQDVRELALQVLAQAAGSDDGRRRIESAKALVAKTGAGVTSERDQLGLYLRAMASILRDVEVLSTGADRALLANADLQPAIERLTAFAGARGRQAFLAIDRALAAIERYANAKIVADWLVLQL